MNNTFDSQLAPYTAAMEEKRAELQAAVAGTTELYTPSADEQAALTEARRAFQAWQATEAGQQKMAELSKMSASEVLAFLEDLLKSEVFDRTFELLTVPPIITDSGFQTFSIAAIFEAQVIVGFNGNLGVAVGFNELAEIGTTDRSSLGGVAFLSLGFDLGVDEGALLGVDFSIWKVAPDDLGGFASSTMIYIDDVSGGGIGATYTVLTPGDDSTTFNPTLLGLSLVTAVGEDDGIDIWNPSYTFILGHTSALFPPIYQKPQPHFLILTKLYCDNISGGDGDKNEVFFTFQPDLAPSDQQTPQTVYTYPTWDYFSMGEGDTWDCGRSVMLYSQVVINLYDNDGTSGNDLLGSTTIKVSELSIGVEKKYQIYSKNGIDERNYYMYAKLVY